METKPKSVHQQPACKASNQMGKLFICYTNAFYSGDVLPFLPHSHNYKFVFEILSVEHLNICMHVWMAAKRAATANEFARFCIELQCFCCGWPSKCSTIIAGNIVRANASLSNALYPEIPIAPSNHSCGRSLPIFLGPCMSAPLHLRMHCHSNERTNEWYIII